MHNIAHYIEGPFSASRPISPRLHISAILVTIFLANRLYLYFLHLFNLNLIWISQFGSLLTTCFTHHYSVRLFVQRH